MSSLTAFFVIIGFFGLLFLVSYLSSRSITAETFYTGNRKSPWYLVAFGMIGATISGVTFISVPGEVGHSGWTYLQFLLGNFLGYWVIALLLIPLYYKLKLVSIYTYLEGRLGKKAYRTGSFFFLISQTIGASFRLYLVSGVLQVAFFNALGLPFWVTVLFTILMIWLYTFRAGIKTVVWTDSFQTLFILLSLGITLILISSKFHLGFTGMVKVISQHPYSRIFDWDWRSGTNFFKQFLAGVGIVIVMNGLDQNMMQKSLTCKSKGEAQKNLYWFSLAFILANLLFLSLGVMLYYYAGQVGIKIPVKSDDLFPTLALNHFGLWAGVLFLLGITAAAYSSADSALTALTTSFCIDFLNLDPASPAGHKKRFWVHVAFSVIMFLVILLFRAINDESVVSAVFTVAGYTYGPLLGLFAFGITTRLDVKDRYVPYLCLLSPIVCYFINKYAYLFLGGYKFGFELLLLNGFLTFIGLFMISKKNN